MVAIHQQNFHHLIIKYNQNGVQVVLLPAHKGKNDGRWCKNVLRFKICNSRTSLSQLETLTSLCCYAVMWDEPLFISVIQMYRWKKIQLVTIIVTGKIYLLPFWHVVRDPLHSLFSRQVLTAEPWSLYPAWQENCIVLPTVLYPNRWPPSGLPGSGQTFSVWISIRNSK